MTHDIQATTAKERPPVPRRDGPRPNSTPATQAAHHEHAFDMEARHHEEQAPMR